MLLWCVLVNGSSRCVVAHLSAPLDVTVLYEELHDLVVALVAGRVQRRAAVLVDVQQPRAVRNQHLRHRQVPVRRRVV